MALLSGGVFINVELKCHIDTDEKLGDGQIICARTTHGDDVYLRVIHRKAQPGNPVGKWKYLAEYIIPTPDQKETALYWRDQKSLE